MVPTTHSCTSSAQEKLHAPENGFDCEHGGTSIQQPTGSSRLSQEKSCKVWSMVIMLGVAVGMIGFLVADCAMTNHGTGIGRAMSKALVGDVHRPQSHLNRRGFISSATVAAAGLVAGRPLGALADFKGPNEGIATSEQGINKLLQSYGFPPVQAPKGGRLVPLVEYIGTAPPANLDGVKTKERAFTSPLLVRFLYPKGWIVKYPDITSNGEAGNIGANDYGTGDAANFASVPLPKGETLEKIKKSFFKAMVTATMTSDVFDDVKIKTKRLVTQPDGTEMAIFDYTYIVFTRAGFEIERQGVGAAQVIDNAIVGLVTAVKASDWNKKGEYVDTMANSFRAYKVKAPKAESENYGAI